MTTLRVSSENIQNNVVTAMFQAFSQAALLNPDQEDETEGLSCPWPYTVLYSSLRLGEAADWIYNDQEIEAGSEQVCEILSSMARILTSIGRDACSIRRNASGCRRPC